MREFKLCSVSPVFTTGDVRPYNRHQHLMSDMPRRFPQNSSLMSYARSRLRQTSTPPLAWRITSVAWPTNAPGTRLIMLSNAAAA